LLLVYREGDVRDRPPYLAPCLIQKLVCGREPADRPAFHGNVNIKVHPKGRLPETPAALQGIEPFGLLHDLLLGRVATAEPDDPISR
jgi:hypothetical protein